MENVDRNSLETREKMPQKVISGNDNQRPVKKVKREYSRVEVSWPATILTAQGPIEGETKNISFRGALIILRELPDLNGPLRLAIEIPNELHAILATVELIRLDIDDIGNDGPSYALGVRFRDISEYDLQFLASAVLH